MYIYAQFKMTFFSILIYLFKNVIFSCDAKIKFSAVILKTGVLLNIFVETMIPCFFSESLDA